MILNGPVVQPAARETYVIYLISYIAHVPYTIALQPAVESAVTRLLVSIKQLLETLTQWSKGEVSETQVSDVYVKLGNDFNSAVTAFTSFNIDMS